MRYTPLRCQPTYMWGHSKRSSEALKYYCTPGVPADIYFLPLRVCSNTLEILPCSEHAADIYFLLLGAVQLTGMKYYPASSMLADIYCPHSNSAATGMTYTRLLAC